MRLAIYVNGTDVGHYSRIADYTLVRESGGKMTKCNLGLFNISGMLDAIVTPGAEVLISQLLAPTGALFDESLFDEVMFGEDVSGGSGQAFFRGYVGAIEPTKWNDTTQLLKLTCQDSTIVLDTLIVTGKNYTTATDDDDIIAEIFGELAPTISLAEVSNVASIPTLKLEGVSLRRALEMICELTGAEWCLTADNVLRYYTPPAATLFFSDAPDGTTTFPYNVRDMRYLKDFRTPTNSVRVNGALKSGSTRYTALAEDTVSQSTYGRVFHRTITDNNVKSDAQALLRAQVEVARYSNPENSGVITFLRDGVDVGKKIGIVNSTLGVSDEFLVRKLTMRQLSPTLTQYTADFGATRPDVVDMLRRLVALAGPAAEAATAVPGPASVGNSSIDRTSSDKLQIETGDIKSLAITAEKIANATITGQQIANVAVKSNHIDDAAVISSKIGNLAVASTHIQNAAIGTDQLANLAVTSEKLGNASVTSEKLGNLAVKAANIDNATITGGKIANLTIVADLIANLTITGGKIADNTITSAKIYDLAVSKISGWNGGTIDVGGAGLSISGTGGLYINTGCGFWADSAAYFYVDCDAYFDSDIVMNATSITNALLVSTSSVQASSYKDSSGSNTIIDSSRNAEFAGLKWTGNLRVPTNTEAIALSGITTAGWFAVYDASGNYVGKCPYFV